MELDERERTIVMLRFFSDCSHEEIASVVDATPGAVRTALSRTLAGLRARFRLASATDPTLGNPPQG
jgi:DNA-directed RNA polymerase specialized sigma24 family protein